MFHRWLMVAVTMAAVLFGFPGAARAVSRSWSMPIKLATGDLEPLGAVACPSERQCTAIEPGGREVTFDPGVPGSTTRVMVDAGGGRPEAIACVSVTQCTLVDDSGREVTFDPTSPGQRASAVVVRGYVPTGIACPSAGQCTAVGAPRTSPDAGYGQAVTFDPRSSRPVGRVAIALATTVASIACPSVSQCTAVGSTYQPAGQELTFNPRSHARPVARTIDRTKGSKAWLARRRVSAPPSTFLRSSPSIPVRSVP